MMAEERRLLSGLPQNAVMQCRSSCCRILQYYPRRKRIHHNRTGAGTASLTQQVACNGGIGPVGDSRYEKRRRRPRRRCSYGELGRPSRSHPGRTMNERNRRPAGPKSVDHREQQHGRRHVAAEQANQALAAAPRAGVSHVINTRWHPIYA